MIIKNIIKVSLILIFLIFFKYYSYKKQEKFLPSFDNKPTDGSVSYYTKKHNPRIIYSSKCQSSGKKERYIWKDEWLYRKSGFKENKFFKETKFIINKEKVKNCSKNCLDDNDCKGYSIKYREGKPIRCIQHYSNICEKKCYNESFLCVRKNKNSYSKDDLCKKNCPEETQTDKGDENDKPEILWKPKVINKIMISFFDKCKEKCFNGTAQETIKDITKKSCANECYSSNYRIHHMINCTGFKYDKTDKKCTLFGFETNF